MPLSVLSTLREALALWSRHWRFFVLLALFLAVPRLVLNPLQEKGPALSVLYVSIAAAGVVIPIVFQAAGMAAALTYLIDRAPRINWSVIWTGVRRHTGQLGVQVLLLLLALLLMIPFGMIIFASQFAFGPSLFFIILTEMVFLIFLKYALADPLVVAENRKAPDALMVSWRMTRNQFGFVFGCYLITGVLGWGIDACISRLDFMSGMWAVVVLVNEYIGTYWYVLPWVMYLQIKAVTGEPPPIAQPA